MSFDRTNWKVETDENEQEKVKFIIYREGPEGIRYVLTKEGKVCIVPHDKIIDSMCGPLTIIQRRELEGLSIY